MSPLKPPQRPLPLLALLTLTLLLPSCAHFAPPQLVTLPPPPPSLLLPCPPLAFDLPTEGVTLEWEQLLVQAAERYHRCRSRHQALVESLNLPSPPAVVPSPN